MEPNKIEQEFKNKLAERTIQPSAQAWDRLDAMLTVAEEKKPKRKKLVWLYAAASFLVFLTVGTFLLQQEKDTDGNIIVTDDAVVTTVTKPESEKQQATEIASPEAESKMIENQVMNQKGVATVIQKSVSNVRNKFNSNMQPGDTNEAEEVETPGTEVAVTPGADKKITKKAKRGITIDPDELLASVENNDTKYFATVKSKEPKTTEPKLKVDANSLLSSVEGELNESFRSKVFQSAVENYNVLKTAVANRNYQQNQ